MENTKGDLKKYIQLLVYLIEKNLEVTLIKT